MCYPVRVNCTYADKIWCTNKKVKRSLFGLGARCCKEAACKPAKCEHKVKHKRPKAPPACPAKPNYINRNTAKHVKTEENDTFVETVATAMIIGEMLDD